MSITYLVILMRNKPPVMPFWRIVVERQRELDFFNNILTRQRLRLGVSQKAVVEATVKNCQLSTPKARSGKSLAPTQP